MNTLETSPESFVFVQGNELVTTSLKIAEAFGKTHAHVLRDIDRVLSQVSDNFGKTNFGLTDYVQENNLGIATSYRMYELTKDGFMMVVMSFTGTKAMAIKEAYINAFNKMHATLFPVISKKITPRPTKLSLEQRHDIAFCKKQCARFIQSLFPNNGRLLIEIKNGKIKTTLSF